MPPPVGEDRRAARLLRRLLAPTASTAYRAKRRHEQTFYADTFGSSITQQRVRLLPCLDAVAVDPASKGNFESMRTLARRPPRGQK